jgi:hypothetical protein
MVKRKETPVVAEGERRSARARTGKDEDVSTAKDDNEDVVINAKDEDVSTAKDEDVSTAIKEDETKTPPDGAEEKAEVIPMKEEAIETVTTTPKIVAPAKETSEEEKAKWNKMFFELMVRLNECTLSSSFSLFVVHDVIYGNIFCPVCDK